MERFLCLLFRSLERVRLLERLLRLVTLLVEELDEEERPLCLLFLLLRLSSSLSDERRPMLSPAQTEGCRAR